MDTRQEQESPINLLIDDVSTKIWVENLKPQDRLAFASTSKKYLAFFKSQAPTAYVHDLLIQLKRVGIIGFTAHHFTGVPSDVIAQLTHAFAEDFRNDEDKSKYNEWLKREAAESNILINPYIEQLKLIKFLFDLGLNELPARLYQPCLFKEDLQDLSRFMCFLLYDTREEIFWNRLRQLAVLPVLLEIYVFLEEMINKFRVSSDIVLPKDFPLANSIKNRRYVVDKVAADVSQMLMQCSERQLQFINQFTTDETKREADVSIVVDKIARYLRIQCSLEETFQGLFNQEIFEHWFYFHFFRNQDEISALQQQSLINTTFPLIQKLKSEHPQLDAMIFLAAGLYCLNAKRFAHLNHTITQFVCAMADLKNENERLYIYITDEFKHGFRPGIEISTGTMALYIEQLTPYLIKGIAQPILNKHFDSLSKVIEHGYYFATAYSTDSIFLQSLQKLDSRLLTADDLEKLIVDIPQCRTADRVVEKFEADRCQRPKVSM